MPSFFGYDVGVGDLLAVFVRMDAANLIGMETPDTQDLYCCDAIDAPIGQGAHEDIGDRHRYESPTLHQMIACTNHGLPSIMQAEI